MIRRQLMSTAALTLATAGCAALTSPVQPPSTNTNTSIVTAFNIAQAALVVVQFVPGVPAVVTTEARNVLSSLQAAYASYQAAPATSTTEQAALQAAITAANSFLQSNGLPAVLATSPAKASAVKLVH